MNSKKDNTENHNNDDLNFIPLDIDSSLAPNSTKFPLQFDIEGISITKTLGTISLGFPNLNINPTPMPLNENPIVELAPLTPYPKNIPTIDSATSLNQSNEATNINVKSNTSVEYQSEVDDSILYSYNEPKVNERYIDDSVNIIDILRNFDISLDFSPSESRKNNCTEDEVNKILSLIEKDNPGILATMKAYRIPYPITKLLIKKIIKISLDNCKR
ncbi:hypothetical protein [Clostridium sp.]|jgi:hypothetical protein|uniref:hypothetical protein n=1 Tax=Clostridium sp. TaxID=1506 RepID=UPI0025BD2DED|nr:hypothetical protein [Clostridium sp.]MCI9064136.1 hypothetical protein [Clostridia bacterium]MCI9303119.1 hypothetical protein [Clostridium sp.]